MIDVLALAAATWGIVMGVSPTLQIRRMRVMRSSADVSLAYLSVLAIGSVLWLSYGLALGNGALIVANTVGFVFLVSTILVALRLRRPRAA